MLTKRFDYTLPKKLIAQKSIYPRDHSRLLVLKRENCHSCESRNLKDKIDSHFHGNDILIDDHFYNLGKYLKKGDVVVLNNTKVIPARLIDNQGKEIFLLRSLNNDDSKWLVLTKYKVSSLVRFVDSTLVGRIDQKIIKFNLRGREFWKEVKKIGEVPTPPYVKSRKKYAKTKKDFYQTIFAKEKGSVAAPTAGFHFTQKLVNRLKKRGVKFVFITLHIGLGTFAPIRVERAEDHQMHAEWFELSKYTADILNKAKKEGHRIIAVGTTATRVLESCAITPLSPITKPNYYLKEQSGETKIFIKPGYKFKFVDALITNFHLPYSTPLLLASAFVENNCHCEAAYPLCHCEPSKRSNLGIATAAFGSLATLLGLPRRPDCVGTPRNDTGIKILLQAYREAIKNNYRFYSFGDAMLIL